VLQTDTAIGGFVEIEETVRFNERLLSQPTAFVNEAVYVPDVV
jgi:hypothetical protein